MKTPSLHAKVRSGLLWSAVQNWGVRLSGLLLFMVMARLLTPEQLGLFAAAMVILTFLNLMADQGLSEAVVQRETITPQQMNAVFWLNMGVSLTVMVVLLLAAPLVATWMKMPALTDILRVASLAMPLTAASFGQLAMRKRAFQYRWLASATLASTLISGLVAIVLAWFGFGTWSLVAQSLIASIVTTLLLWTRSEWKLGRQTDFAATRPLMNYGWHRLGTYLLDFGNTRFIELFLAATLGPAMLAMYAVGTRVYQALMQALSSTVLEVAHNGFSRLANDRPALVEAYYKSMTVSAAVAVPLLCLIAAVAEPLTVVLFGAKWTDSAEVMRFMCLLGAVQVLQFYNGTVYNAVGKPQIGLYFVACKVPLTFAGLYLGSRGGMTGLLIGYIASQLLTTPVSFYLARRIVGISMREILRRILPFLIGCLLLFAAGFGSALALEKYTHLPAFFDLAAASLAAAGLYLAFLRLFAKDALRDAVRMIRPPKAAAVEQPPSP